MYNKINVVRHLEERECLNCGKKWDIVVKRLCPIKQVHFCKDCLKLLSPNQRRNMIRAKIPESNQRKLLYNKEHHRKHIIHYMWYRAKQRAEKYGYEFNIEESDIIIPKICPILEVPIVLGEKSNYEYTPSLDRIDNSKGYVKGNIQVISKKANSMKNSASKKELITFCKNILRYSLTTAENECSEQEDKEPLG